MKNELILINICHFLQFDHLEFPGVVPRTFIGPLAVILTSSPFWPLLRILAPGSKFAFQLLGVNNYFLIRFQPIDNLPFISLYSARCTRIISCARSNAFCQLCILQVWTRSWAYTFAHYSFAISFLVLFFKNSPQHLCLSLVYENDLS